MPFVTVGRENSAAIRIYHEDSRSGPPVVLVHGYAPNGHSWEKQEAALLAADLDVLLRRLDLREVVLAGFAMGTGEVTRYLAVQRPARASAAVLVAPLPP